MEVHGALRQLLSAADRGARAARRRRARPRLAPPRRLGQRAGHAPARDAAHAQAGWACGSAATACSRRAPGGRRAARATATSTRRRSARRPPPPSCAPGTWPTSADTDAAARHRPLVAPRAPRARPARRRARRPAARRAARLPPGARPARGPPRARAGPLHRRAARARAAGRDHRGRARAQRRDRPAGGRPSRCSASCGSRTTQAQGDRHGAAAARSRPRSPTLDAAQAQRGHAQRAACRRRRTTAALPAGPPARRLPVDPDLAQRGDRGRGGDDRGLEPQVAAANAGGRSRHGEPGRAARAAAGRPPRRSPRSSQQVADQLDEVDAANAAVAAARALLDELRASQPRVSEALRASNVADGLGLRRRWRAGVAAARWDDTTIPFGSAGLPARSSAGGPGDRGRAARARRRRRRARGPARRRERPPARAGQRAARGSDRRRALARRRPAARRRGRAHAALRHRGHAPAARARRPGRDRPPAGRPTPTQVRAKVEPALEAWAGSVLGPASRVLVRARYTSATTVTPPRPTSACSGCPRSTRSP